MGAGRENLENRAKNGSSGPIGGRLVSPDT
jgi:hypothetical protein